MNSKKQKTILITGGAGFIGSHLCAALTVLRHSVTCLDSLVTGSEMNIARLKNNSNFRFIKHDIVDHIEIEEKIDEIYNCACPASPIHYQANPIRTIKTNTIGVINVLGLAKKHGSKVLQTSTSEIYGDPLEHPQKETYRGNVNTIGPRACYDEGKRIAEAIFFEYYRAHKISIRVARIFNTYGPNMAKEDRRVISNFIIQALQGKPITIYGDGSQTRSFCYIDDMVRGLIAFMENKTETGPINLGNPEEYSIKDIALKIIKETGSESKIIFKDLPIDDPTRRKPDIFLAKKKLNWSPKINLNVGLKKTIEYFKSVN